MRPCGSVDGGEMVSGVEPRTILRLRSGRHFGSFHVNSQLTTHNPQLTTPNSQLSPLHQIPCPYILSVNWIDFVEVEGERYFLGEQLHSTAIGEIIIESRIDGTAIEQGHIHYQEPAKKWQ